MSLYSQDGADELGLKDSSTIHDTWVDAKNDENMMDRSEDVSKVQDLGDVESLQEHATSNTNQNSSTVLKRLSHFIRQHEFFTHLSIVPFTTSNRRKFERDIYDFSRSLGLSRTQAKEEMVKTRQFCGERGYDSDNSAWADEVNDSLDTLRKLSSKPPKRAKVGGKGKELLQQVQDVVSIPNEEVWSNVEEVGNQGSYTVKDEVRTEIGPSEPTIGWSYQDEIGESKKRKSPEIDYQRHSTSPLSKRRNFATIETSNKKGLLALEAHYRYLLTIKKAESKLIASEKQLNSPQLKTSVADLVASVRKQTNSRTEVNTASSQVQSIKRKSKDRKKTRDLSNLTARDMDTTWSTNSTEQSSERKSLVPSNAEAEVGKTERMSPMETKFAPEQMTVTHDGIEDGEQPHKRKRLNCKKAREIIDERAANEMMQQQKEKNVAKGGTKATNSLHQSIEDKYIQNNEGSTSSDSVSMTAADEGLSIEVEAPVVEEGKDEGNMLDSPMTPKRNHEIMNNSSASSPLSSALSSPEFPSEYPELHAGDNNSHPENSQSSHFPDQDEIESSTASKLRTPRKSRPSTTSPYFPKMPTQKAKGEKISCIPFPPLDASSFGLVQETLSHDPFRLLIAVIFLTKTRGSVAIPIFYSLITHYPTPAALASAKLSEIVSVFQSLGLQNQRAIRCIQLAQTWLEDPPQKGKRYRRLHYPNKDDGKDIDPNEGPIPDDDERVAWEVGHLSGLGAYAIDSWRIFCRDALRGLPHGLPSRQDLLRDDAATRERELSGEWTRVLPRDKELRAYLRWRWLRVGVEWDPQTGSRGVAAEVRIRDALRGGVVFEDGDGRVLEVGDGVKVEEGGLGNVDDDDGAGAGDGGDGGVWKDVLENEYVAAAE